ncbi:MAG: O-antigen ligase family protein [Lachnospiraceae bacterium]
MKQYRKLKLLPLQFILAVLPLITYYYQGHSGYGKYGWNSENDTYHDFFLHYKMIAFIIVSIVMFVGVFFAFREKKKEQWRKLLLCFTPLFVYLFFVVLSTAFSADYALSFFGAMEQNEPFPVLFGYVITAFYAWLVVEREEDVRALTGAAVVGAVCMALLGVLQALGKDPLTMEGVQRLIADDKVLEEYGLFVLSFPSGQAYGTLFNPNYVGSYVPLYLPLLLFGAINYKQLWKKLCCIAAFLGLLVMLFASQSRTGLISVIAVLIVLLIFSIKYVIRYWYVIVPALTALVLGFFLTDAYMDSLLTLRLQRMFDIEKTEYALRGFDTTGNGVKVFYKDTEFTVMMPVSGGDFAYIVTERGEKLPVTYSEDKSMGYVTLSNGDTISIQTAIYEDLYAFGLPLEGRTWYFTNQIEPGNYKFITEHGKVDECTMPGNVMEGYDAFASSRGYSWGRTISLLKDHIFIGSGPDTFAITFPQTDYVARYRLDATNIIFTRPHNFYLQMALQTGVASLVAFLVFYVIYAVQCCKLYFVRKFNHSMEWLGFAIFLGTVGFMAVGMANDSLIVVSPVFYLLLGAGMAVNKLNKEAGEKELCG